MSTSDELRTKLALQKSNKSQKDGIAEAFNGVTLKLIKKFIAEVDAGSVQLEDIADLNKLFQMYMTINDLNNTEAGTGVLPTMVPSQKGVFETEGLVKTVKSYNDDEEDQEFIDLEALAKMDSGEIQKMMIRREEQVNKDNEGAF